MWIKPTSRRYRESLSVRVEMMGCDLQSLTPPCCDVMSRAGRAECSLPSRLPFSRNFCLKASVVTHFRSKRFHASVLLFMSFQVVSPKLSFKLHERAIIRKELLLQTRFFSRRLSDSVRTKCLTNAVAGILWRAADRKNVTVAM